MLPRRFRIVNGIYYYYLRTRIFALSIAIALFALWQGIIRIVMNSEAPVGILSNNFYGWLLIIAASLLLITSLSTRLYSIYLRNFSATVLSCLLVMSGIDAWRNGNRLATSIIVLACCLLFYDALWKAECPDA